MHDLIFLEKVVSSSPTLRSDRSSSQITSNDGSRFRTSSNAFLQDLESRDDLPAIPFESSEDGDDFNNQLQKRSLFRSLQHNPSHVSPNASSLSIKSGTSSRAQSDSSKLNTKKPRSSISSNNSTVPSSYSNHSESSQQNPLMAKTLLPDRKREEIAKIIALLKPKKYMKLKDTHHNTTNDFGQPVTISKSPVDFSSITSPSKTTNSIGVSSRLHMKEIPEYLLNSTSDSVEVVVYPKEHLSATSIPHHGYDVPMIQPSVTQTSHDYSVVRNDDDLDVQQNTSETNNRPDSTLITQPPGPSLISEKFLLVERVIAIVREISGDFTSDKPSTSPNVQSSPLNSTTLDSNPIFPKDNSPVEERRKPDMNPFLLNVVTPQVVSKEVPEKAQPPKTQPWRPPLRTLQRISESGDSLPDDDFTLAPDDILARKMESCNLTAQSKASPETLPSRTNATELQLQTLQEDNSSDAVTLLREAYLEQQQALQNQLDKALAELRDAQAENKGLTSENQSQQRSISQLKIALAETKHEQDNSLIQKNTQLRVATVSLTRLNKEKKGWQDKLDSMHHKLNAAERQVRCLDHLTRHKLKSRQKAGFSQPKRKGLFASNPASTDVIGKMRALNKEIYQTCVQFVEGLERTAVFSSQPKSQARKVLGVHLTAMMEDQAKKATSGSYMLLMQTVLEVFMTRWCSSIIEAFYPQQESSFADLLVQLSADSTEISGPTCGKQIKIIQTSTLYDSVEFNEWVSMKDIIKELGLFLTVAGLRMKTQCATLFSTKTLALVKVAYDLRTVMAEKDICGGLEIVIVPPDTLFQEKWMIDAHADPRKVETDPSRVDYVAGTTGIGLQRKVLEVVDGRFQSRMELELKPKVTLAHSLKSQTA